MVSAVNARKYVYVYVSYTLDTLHIQKIAKNT